MIKKSTPTYFHEKGMSDTNNLQYTPLEKLAVEMSVRQMGWNGFPQQTPHLLSGQTEASNKEHRDILQVIKQRDAEQASKLVLVYRHISRTGENLVQGITESTP